MSFLLFNNINNFDYDKQINQILNDEECILNLTIYLFSKLTVKKDSLRGFINWNLQ